MKIIQTIIFLSIICMSSGCATFLRYKTEGTVGKVVNIQMALANKDIRVFQENLELSYKVLYDGSEKSSPFLVRQYKLVSAPDELVLEVEKNGSRQTIHVAKVKEKPHFWPQGFFFLVDYATKATHYYEDVAID